MKERLVIIVVAIVAGLIITAAGFFIYQSTKISPTDEVANADTTPTPGIEDNLFVRISEPANESITDNRTVEISGTTNPENILVVSTNSEDVTGTPDAEGDFSLTVEIDAGANILIVRAIAPNGDEIAETRSVTYSTEEF